MYYSLIRKMDISNGPGIRISLFVSGCTKKCPNCFNPETHSFTNGSEYTLDTQDKILKLLDNQYVRGLSFLGGDPLEQKSDDIKEWLIPLATKVKEMNKDIWLWTGFTWEEIFKEDPHGGPQTIQEAVTLTNLRARRELISLCDVVVDGPYIDAQRDITLPYCGSTNQRVIDVKKTLETGEVTLYEK